MTAAERVLAHFERISEAPDAITRLRQFILELAISGRLVAQLQVDDSVVTLLARIRTLRLVAKTPSTRASAPDATGVGHPVAPSMPAGWQLVRLGDLSDVVMGQSPPGSTYNKAGEGLPLINGPLEFSRGPFGKTVVNQYTTAPTNVCEEGDFLLCVRGSTTGRTNVAGFRACIGRGVAAICAYLVEDYVRLFIWSRRSLIIEMGRGIAFPSISRQQIQSLAVPLPPLAEQNRIVAKVAELMTLCDRLEAAKKEREQRRDRVVMASLARLNQSTDAPSFREHGRFHLEHLPQLVTTHAHVQQLRESVLDLACQRAALAQEQGDKAASAFETSEQNEHKDRARTRLPPGWSWRRIRMSPTRGWARCGRRSHAGRPARICETEATGLTLKPQRGTLTIRRRRPET